MSRDSSYAEYVDLRWWKLCRLAILLVGEERGRRATARALERAYLSWPEVRAEASPDEHLEEMLAQEAIEEPAAVRHEHGFDGLPVRQRVAVVLRFLELLSDVQIARALGCRPNEVDTEVSAALRTLGLSVAELTAELERRSDEIVVPAAPVESLLAHGHERRRRQRRRTWEWAVVVMAAALAALGVASWLQGSDEPVRRRPTKPIPAAIERLPVGHVPRVAYVDGGELHLAGGRSLALREQPTALVQAAHGVYVSYPSGTLERVDLRSLATKTLTTSSAGQVVADPSGRYVAWEEARPGARRPLVVVRVIGSRGETLRQQPREFPAGTAPFVLVSLDRSGDVFASRPALKDGAWVWRAGLIPAPGRRLFDRIVGVGNGTLHQVVGAEVVVQYPGWFSVGGLDGASVILDHEVPGVMADFADPGARRVVYVDDGEAYVVEAARSGSTPEDRALRLGLPPREEIVGLRWEDAGHVLIDVTDTAVPHGAIVRCDVSTGNCDLAVTFRGPHLLAR